MAILDLVGAVRAVSWQSAAGWLAGLLLAAYAASAVRVWYPLRHVPGPRLASFSYGWKVRTHLSARVNPTFADLRRYGPLVRVGPRYVLSDEPAELRRTEAVRAAYARDGWYAAGRLGAYDDMATTLDTAEHDRLKAKVLPGYQGRDDVDMEGAVDSQVRRLLALIRRRYVSTAREARPMDFAPLSRFFTLDVVTRLIYGEPFGHLDEGEDVYGFVEQIDMAMKVMGIALDVPGVRNLLLSSTFQRYLGPKKGDKWGIGKVMSVASEFVDERWKDPGARRDMLAGLIRNGLTQTECDGHAMLGILAGSDTTASAIRAIVFSLLRTPQAYRKLKEEIRDVLAGGDVPSPVPMQTAAGMDYLQAVIWEAFRMHPVFTHGHYKVVPAGGDTISGYFLPAGTSVGHNIAAIMRKEAIWGDDADTFRPERFLECDKGKRNEMDRAVDSAFGGGRWMCAGRNVAFTELNKLTFELFRHFDLEFVNPDKPWVESSYLTPHHLEMWLKVTEVVA